MSITLVFRSTDNLKWGPGKDAKLTIAEGDGNLWALQTAIQGLIDNPPSAASISNIIVVGSQMSIQLTDGKSFGPFALPVAAFNYRSEGYLDGSDYRVLDLVPVLDSGLYMVLVDHTASGAFSPLAEDSNGNPLFQLLFGQDTSQYEVKFFVPGKPGEGIDSGDPVFGHLCKSTIHALATDSNSLGAKLLESPAADLSFSIRKNDTAVGSLDFPSGQLSGTVTWTDDVEFQASDLLLIIAPDSVDMNAKNLSANIVLRSGPLP